ncbi:MAG: IclR family transcriptional regulator [Thermodesulfobacteriota bacterium]
MELVQSIERAASVLRCLGRGNPLGRRLVDVARETGLNKVTARRILGTLVKEGLVEHEAETGLFRLGLGLTELARAAVNHRGIYDLAYPAMIRLAELTGDTIYLTLRHGLEAICLERVEGSFPIKTLTLKTGDRRPLGVGAGSLALLAFLPPEEIAPILEANSPLFGNYGVLKPEDVPQLVALAQKQGYGSNDGNVIPDMSAVAVPIMGSQGRPFASLSVAAITSRLQGARRRQVVAWLQQEARAIEQKLPPDERLPTLELQGVVAASGR